MAKLKTLKPKKRLKLFALTALFLLLFVCFSYRRSVPKGSL